MTKSNIYENTPEKVVLFVTCDEVLQEFVPSAITDNRANYIAMPVTSCEEAIEIVESRQVDLVCTYLFMPGMNGVDLLDYLRENHPAIPYLAFSAFGSSDMYKVLKEKGALGHIDMPFSLDELLSKIDNALCRKAMWD